MQTRNRNTFTTIHTEGALLPVDLLQRIGENDKGLDGLTPESYHLAPGEKLNEAINRSWNRMNGLWGAFKTSRSRLGPGDAGTTLTRERWLLPLFQELGFGRLSTAKAVEIEGKSYAISHRWDAIPIHLVGCGLELDTRTPGAAGAARISPHSLMQEYLNRSTDAQWGLVSNGLNLRVLRDNATLTRQAYVDFDLESMFEGEVYSDFVLLWLVCHQSRFEAADKQGECLLEGWSKNAQEQGTRALDDMRSGVEKAIVSLGQGFLKHPLNQDLRARLKQGQLSGQEYYRQLLRLVYRLIFLFTAEDRDLLLLPDAALEAKDRYTRHYSTARLRALAQRQRGSRHHDRYEALRLVMRLLDSEKGCPELALPALGGLLFDERFTPDLNTAVLDNQSLLASVRNLAFIEDGKTNRAVDYRNLGSEELGSVYEALLELHPQLNIDAGTFGLLSAAGNERKTSGSYYTPTSLIRVLLDSALEPVIEDALRGPQSASSGTRNADSEQRLLALKVCDPACGSGHFLIAAAHRIAGRLAQARAGGDEPPPSETRRALRDVIRHCIYGVDLNPMAVELCKVNLWLESLEPGKPLSFLDAHIKCGNSLVGVGPGAALEDLEVPDEAFNPVTGDDKATAGLLKKRNKSERAGQESLFVTVLKTQEDLEQWLAERARALEAMPEESAAEVQAKAEAYRQVSESTTYRQKRLAADLWTAAFFWPIEKPTSTSFEILAPTQGQLRRLRGGQALQAGLTERVDALAQSQGFFHWPLEFADVTAQGGFDCVLGNPPWERIKLQEEEFFAKQDPEIANAPNKTSRQKLIDALSTTNPTLAVAFAKAKHIADAESKFVRTSFRYPLTGTGDVNTYALFSETISLIMSNYGRAGFIVPSGLAIDNTTKEFFSSLVTSQSLVSFFEFENEGFFSGAGQGHMLRFALTTIVGQNSRIAETSFLFQGKRIKDLSDSRRVFTLSSNDIFQVNPNTRTCPIFQTRQDAVITKFIYSNVPVLMRDTDSDIETANPWGIRFLRMFDSANDSYLFRTKLELSKNGYSLDGNHFLKGKEIFVPVYEAKMIYTYDHRHGDFNDAPFGERIHILPNIPEEKLQDPSYLTFPYYWINEVAVQKILHERNWYHKWLMGWRDVTDSRASARTLIAGVIPYSGVSDKFLLMLPSVEPKLLAALIGNLCSIVCDYIARQKVGGLHFKYFTMKQIPILSPNTYTFTNNDFITPRLLELIYTTYDLGSFAEDMGYHGEPFRWDEDRRAVLRAELDAYYARLYGLNRKQLRYILDPADLTPRELEDILAPWEEVSDPLDSAGYEARRASSDFPGETFRVLKDKEFRQFGEYRTRRLVLEAWERLEGVAPAPVSAPAVEPAAAPPEVKVQAVVEPVKEKSKPEAESQPMLSDFGLYKCESCGKMVMGYEKENHLREKHGGKSVEWRKVR